MGEERTRVNITLANGETITHTDEHRHFKSVRDDIIRDIGESGCVVLDADNHSRIINFAHVSSICVSRYRISEW